LITEKRVNTITGDLIEYLKKYKLDPQERIIVLKSAAAILENIISSEMMMMAYKNMLDGKRL